MGAANASRTITVEAFAAELGISKTLAYEQARTGAIAGVPVLRVGRRLLIARAAAERALAIEPTPQPSPDDDACAA